MKYIILLILFISGIIFIDTITSHAHINQPMKNINRTSVLIPIANFNGDIIGNINSSYLNHIEIKEINNGR